MNEPIRPLIIATLLWYSLRMYANQFLIAFNRVVRVEKTFYRQNKEKVAKVTRRERN